MRCYEKFVVTLGKVSSHSSRGNSRALPGCEGESMDIQMLLAAIL